MPERHPCGQMIFVEQRNSNNEYNESNTEFTRLAQVIVVDKLPPMKGRPTKSEDKKMGVRMPFVATGKQYADYRWAADIADKSYISEWIRETLDAEVARLRKKRKP